jgi:cellulose synthase/poly-beta-1,6-N-acetylglucosamine synthase-like glycosyltransferase
MLYFIQFAILGGCTQHEIGLLMRPHEKISVLGLLFIPLCHGFVHGHDVLVLIMKYIFIRKVVGVLSHKGFLRVKIWCLLCMSLYVMLYFPLHLHLLFTLLLRCS